MDPKNTIECTKCARSVPPVVDAMGGIVDAIVGMVDVVGGMVGVMGVMVGVMDKDMRFNSL